MAEVIIIDVTLNSQDATKKANELGAAQRAIKEEQKELKAQGKELDAAYLSNAATLKQLSAEQKAYVTVAASAEGSNNQLRGQLALLTQQYNALGIAERDNTTAGKSLAIQIRSISDELKVNESAVGDNRRNVGNYKDALSSATDEVGKQKDQLSALGGVIDKAPIGFKILGDQIGNVSNQIKNFRQAQAEAAEAQDKFAKLQAIATAATEESAAATEAATAIGFKFAAGEATEAQAIAANTLATEANIVATAAQTEATEAQAVATGLASEAANVFKIALASTGIGAIIVLVAALISYLSDFDPLLDLIEQAFAGLKAGVDALGRVIVGFISNITSVGDLLSKLGNIIAHPIDSFKSLGKEIGNAAKAAYNLKAAQQDLADQQKIQEVANARAEQQIKALILQSKNRSLAESDRQKLLKQASDLETKTFNDRTKLVDKDVSLALTQAQIKGKLSDDELKRLADRGTAEAIRLQNAGKIGQKEVDQLQKVELAKISNLEDSTNRQEKIQNQSDALAEKAAKAEEARQAKLQEAAKKTADAEKARLESLLKTNEDVLSARQREIASINLDIDEKVTKYKKYGATTEQLERERRARLNAAALEFNKKDADAIEANNRSVQDILVNSIKDQGAKQLAQLQLNNTRQLEENDKQIAAVTARILQGEQNLGDLLKSITEQRTAINAQNTLDKQKAIDDQYKIELDAYNQHNVDLANAQIAAAGTDAEKLVASQALLDAQYQQQIDAANLAGQDTTAINATYEAQKKAQTQATNDAAFKGAKDFSTAFQGLTKENTSAYKIAGAVAAKVDAAQALRNNILIVQENIKALTAQGKLPFPTNLIAIASTLAALVGAVSAAKTIVAPVALATGGVFDSGGRGGLLPGYSKKDNTNAFLRSGEAVIVSEATKDPKALAALNAINVAYGGAALAPGIAMASGGIAQGGFISDITQDSLNSSDIVNLIVAGVSAAPRPIVDVRTITTAQQSNQIDVANSNL